MDYRIRVIDGRYVVGGTTNGIDFRPIPTGAFGKPRDAVRYAEMRERNVQPLRTDGEGPTDLPQSTGPSPAVLTRRRISE